MINNIGIPELFAFRPLTKVLKELLYAIFCEQSRSCVYCLELSLSQSCLLSEEVYKGEIKVDNYQTKLHFIQHLRALPFQLLQLQLSLSNEMTDQLICGPIKEMGVLHRFTQNLADLLCSLLYIHISPCSWVRVTAAWPGWALLITSTSSKAAQLPRSSRSSTQIKHQVQIFSQLNYVSIGISRFQSLVANFSVAFKKCFFTILIIILAEVFLQDTQHW